MYFLPKTLQKLHILLSFQAKTGNHRQLADLKGYFSTKKNEKV